jgi:hypothetical protein
MTVIEMRELMTFFDRLPKIVRQQTYLELCKYPRRRFEEICSRLLAFYLDPKKEHGFHDLFLQALFEILKVNDIYYKENDITTKLEVNAEGKRLDILIEGNTFAVGIENKIYAPIDNPLKKYKNHLQKQTSKKTFLLVLSLRKLNENERIKLNENNFTFYTYKEYYDIIKCKLGNYINQGNLKYFAFIADFIETMENMYGGNSMNREIEAFFIDNSDKIDEMNKLYDAYKTERRQKVVEFFDGLQAEIAEKTDSKTGDGGWWLYEDWALGYTSPSGIEIFVQIAGTRENPVDKCHISIVSKKLNVWTSVSEEIKKRYHNVEIQQNGNQTVLPIAVIPGDNNEAIIAKLQEAYVFLNDLPMP